MNAHDRTGQAEGTEVSIPMHVEQVTDGTHYKGTITIGGVEFAYEMVFTQPIPEIDQRDDLPSEMAGIRELIPITLMRDGAEIELTEEEYGFFFGTLFGFVTEFYNSDLTRESQEGAVGGGLSGEGILAALGAKIVIGLSRTVPGTLTPSACEMLRNHKFGCSFTD